MAIAYYLDRTGVMKPHLNGAWVTRTTHDREMKEVIEDMREMRKAMYEALEFLESLGYISGDVHDNLKFWARRGER